MQLSDLIPPQAAAGAALFLTWQSHHIFAITRREVRRSPRQLRFSGVGGKRSYAQEAFADCALREGREEIGDAIAGLTSAPQTFFLPSQGEPYLIDLTDEPIQPRLVYEKRRHSSYGSMADSLQPYYLVGFDGVLARRPTPQQELAAIVHLTDQHLHLFPGAGQDWPTVAALCQAGVQIQTQAAMTLSPAAQLIPHGTARLLLTLQRN